MKMKYIVKIFRHRPYRTYYLTHNCRVCTFEKKHARRFDTYEEALQRIAEFGAGKNEYPMVVEVKE